MPIVYKNVDGKMCQAKVLDFYQIFVNSKKKSWEGNAQAISGFQKSLENLEASTWILILCDFPLWSKVLILAWLFIGPYKSSLGPNDEFDLHTVSKVDMYALLR